MDYSEKQRISSPVFLTIFLAALVLSLAAMGYGFYEDSADLKMYELIWILVIVIVIEGSAFYLVFRTTLETSVSSAGYSFRFFPFVSKTRTLPFTEIHSWEIRRIHNFREFGGLGLRRNLRKTGYVMGGNEGVEIHMLSGKIYVFSSHNAFMLQKALQKYAPEKEKQG